MRISIRKLGMIPILVAAMAACSSDDPAGMVSLGVEESDGLRVEMLAAAPLRVGLNRIFYRLTDVATEEPVLAATIAQGPVMRMPMHDHACPFSDPAAVAGTDGLFEGEIVFTMTNEDGRWDNEVKVVRGGVEHAFAFNDLTIGEGFRQMLRVGEGDERVTYVLTLTFLEAPRVGLNDFVLTIHRRDGHFSFPEMPSMEVGVTPFMPAHGHGSTGSVDPSYVGSGKYEGVVSFNMGGTWTIDFDVTDLGTVVFELTI
ncbi:MAG: FixH family protein [Myxococcales bacterium]|nr:FixH family protein [Myxococcales bacterium]